MEELGLLSKLEDLKLLSKLEASGCVGGCCCHESDVCCGRHLVCVLANDDCVAAASPATSTAPLHPTTLSGLSAGPATHSSRRPRPALPHTCCAPRPLSLCCSLTLSKIEQSGLLSKAEKSGVLSFIADKCVCVPGCVWAQCQSARADVAGTHAHARGCARGLARPPWSCRAHRQYHATHALLPPPPPRPPPARRRRAHHTTGTPRAC
jgi:hypothetical protein